MFTEMRVHNFKSWEDTGPIRLAPVTAFFGTNSSGKTSLLQALLLMKQTVESTDRRQVLHLGGDRAAAPLGLFGDVVHNHDQTALLGLEFSWRPQEPMTIQRRVRQSDEHGDDKLKANRLSFFTRVGADGGNLYVDRFGYTTKDIDLASIEYSRQNGSLLEKPEYNLTATIRGSSDYVSEGRDSVVLPPPISCYALPHQVVHFTRHYYTLIHFEMELQWLFGRLLYYLGPLRQPPGRYYRWQGEHPPDLGLAGERAIEALLSQGRHAEDNGLFGTYSQSGAGSERLAVDTRVAQWLKQMELAHSFGVERVAEDADLYRVTVRRSADSQLVLLPDVGFGVSQVIPVLVMLAYVPVGSVIILEQPELHLHPSAQSALADVILETAKARRAQVILETHSEHLLRRIQRRVAEEKAAADQIALHFCHYEDGLSRLETLELTELGEIGNWPPGFFGDPLGESGAMVEARARRARSQ